MADGRTGKGYPKAQHSNSSPLNNIAGHQHGRDTGASTRNWHGCGLPTRVVGVSARCPHRRALLTPARVISPSRCRQRASMPATSSRCRQLALALWGSALGSRPPSRPRSRHLPLGRTPSARGTHTRTPIYATRAAHKGLIPPLCAAPCFLIPSLVCDTEKDARCGAECAGRGHPQETLSHPHETLSHPQETLSGPLGTPSGPQRTHGKGTEGEVLRGERRAARSGPG